MLVHRYLMYLVGPIPVDELGSLSRAKQWISDEEDLMHSHFMISHALLPLLLIFDTGLWSIIHSRGRPRKEAVNELPLLSLMVKPWEGKNFSC